MEFFERAHVTHKDSSKKKNKSEGAVKMQLKQMLHAYKSGNNHEIKTLANNEHSYDYDDMKSVSDYSEINFYKDADISQGSNSSHENAELRSNISASSSSHDHSSSTSNVTQTESSGILNTTPDNDEKEFNSLSLSQDISTTDKDFSSILESSELSEEYSDSEISLPSSLQTSSDYSHVSENEAFDPDGTLANKILKKLGKPVKKTKKRKLVKVDIMESSSSSKEEMFHTKESSLKPDKKESKVLKKSDNKTYTKVFSFNHVKNQAKISYRDIKVETGDDSLCDADSKDSQLSGKSSQFISVSASDIQSESLSDIIGNYIHPTVKNLPAVHYESNEYAILNEITNDDNVEDISSLIPEIGEDLAIEDLTLETDTQEPTGEATLYDDTVQTEDYFEEETSTDNIEPTVVPIKVYTSRNHYILVMKHPAELFVHGKVKVTAIGGSVEVYGFTLEDKSIDLYAPYHNIAYRISTIESPSTFNGLFSRLSSAGLKASEGQEIVTGVTDNDAVIILSKLNCPKMDFVDNNFNVTELFTKRVDLTPQFLKKVAETLGCSLYIDPPKRVLVEKSSWEQVITCGMIPQSRGIICGGKGTGKSTLLRYYVNRLLRKGPVLVIDLDPGQAEFTVPGNVSAHVVYHPLIGPNFTHLSQPKKMLNIGMINTMDNPSRYISAVTELVNYCQSTQSFHELPWIVNTMGMCNQMGLKFISRIILEIQPTFVYQIDSKIAKRRFEFELQSHAVINFYEEQMKGHLFRTAKYPCNLDYTFMVGINEANGMSPQKGRFALLPQDERYLNVLAYFGQLLDIYGKNILDIVPYEVDLRNLSIGSNVKIPEHAVTKVINGKIIALCQLAAADKGKMFTLGDKALLCHGYALIRGIDYEKGILYMLTPVRTELELVNALVYADWMPELRQEKDLPGGTVVPYRSASIFHERRLMFPPRRRFNPIQLLKATRSA